MNLKIKNRLSLFAFIFLSMAVLAGRCLLQRFGTHDVLDILTWDVFGYYLYLPAKFIYHDLALRDFSWVQHILDLYKPTIGFYQAYMGPEGDYVLKYSMGLAILYSPFFFLGHITALISGFPADGFSLPYQVSIAFGSIVYAVAGIWILRKILNRFFSDGIVAITMVMIVIGTNYFELTAFDGAMAHNVLFTLFGLILWLTIRWHEEPKWEYAIFLGIAIGMSILARPTSAVIVLVPLLWGAFDRETWITKWTLIRNHYFQIIVMIVFLCIPPFFQMIYWKIHAGSFFYYSYESNEKLNLIGPYLWQVLFSYKKGWLVYTPLMTFPIIGLYFLAEKNKNIFYSVFLFFLFNLGIVASWPTWWYGGSLGQRALMESYVILALPLGYFLQWLVQKGRWLTSSCFIVILFFILLNLFQTWQYMNFMIDPSNMTKEYYWAIFGKTKVAEESKQYLEGYTLDAGSILKDDEKFNIRQLALYDFENKDFPYYGNLSTYPVFKGTYSFRMDSNMQFSPGIKINYSELTKKVKAGIKVSVWVYSKVPFTENPANLVVTSNHDGLNYRYEAILFERENLVAGRWNKIVLNYIIPDYPDPKDMLQAYLWYRGKKDLFVDDLKIELFEPKE